MPYCHPQANPHEGSMNLQMYMVNAPFIGYMTAISASACIIRYLNIIIRIFSRRDCEFVNPYIMQPIVNPLDLSVKVGIVRQLTNDHETDDHGARTTSLKSTATSDEETCADSAAAEIKSACALVQILIRKADESSIKESLSKARRPGAARKEGIIQLKRRTWRSSACVSLSAFGAACFDRLRQWLHRWRRH